jgi:hypothetical protein
VVWIIGSLCRDAGFGDLDGARVSVFGYTHGRGKYSNHVVLQINRDNDLNKKAAIMDNGGIRIGEGLKLSIRLRKSR